MSVKFSGNNSHRVTESAATSVAGAPQLVCFCTAASLCVLFLIPVIIKTNPPSKRVQNLMSFTTQIRHLVL